MQIEVYKMIADEDTLIITLEAICDSFSSLLWDIEYYDCGRFEVYIAANPQNISIFQTGRIVGRDDDSLHFGIIESVHIDTDAENGDYLTVRGRFLMCLLERRIIHPTYSVTTESAYSDIVRNAITLNAISGDNRRIPGLSLGDVPGTCWEQTTKLQVSYTNLMRWVYTICVKIGGTANIRLVKSSGEQYRMVFDLSEGTDRSLMQEDNPHIIFSDAYSNLLSFSYAEDASVQLKFTFDGDWKRFHKVVQFSQCDETYCVVLGFDGTSCYLPAELHVGAVKMSVFGYDAESNTTVRATTVPVTLNIRPSGFVGDDDPPIPPTPDLYTQLLKKIEEAGHGADGKSAYEIAVEHGYVGTEEEWLASLKGEPGETPDMSEYPKTSEVTTIVEREIEAATGDFHSHANKATLDAFTPELLQELSDLQQFEDRAQYEIQTINEELLTLNAQRHTHNNKDVLDTITEQYMQDEAAFRASTSNALYSLSTGLSEVSAQAHSHANKSVLDSITQEMLDGIASATRQAHSHHNLATLNGITDSHVSRWNEAYTAAMNLNERVGVNEGVFERFKTEILYDMQGAKTSITDILTRLSAVEDTLSGVEEALADIVEVSE